jgi:endonuclease YncB( thermonuclease family)
VISRRKRAIVIGLGLIATALLVWLDRDFIGPQWSTPSSSRRQTISVDLARYDRGEFRVVRVVDGDTLHLGVPDGGNTTTKVRLLGIDAPEMGFGGGTPMYFAEEATALARDLALGGTVRVYLDESAGIRDKYGRLLAYIELPDGRFLNEELLLAGCAYADLRFRHSYYYRYRQLEAGARAAKQGLWAHVSPEQQPQWRQERQADTGSQ